MRYDLLKFKNSYQKWRSLYMLNPFILIRCSPIRVKGGIENLCMSFPLPFDRISQCILFASHFL